MTSKMVILRKHILTILIVVAMLSLTTSIAQEVRAQSVNYFQAHVKLLGVKQDTGAVQVCMTLAFDSTPKSEVKKCGVLDTSISNKTGALVFYEQKPTWDTKVCVDLWII